MPIYEYECECGGRHERNRPMSESAEPDTCPKCGHQARRIMSGFKWYMGWNHLKWAPSEPAPNDAGYHPKWDAI